MECLHQTHPVYLQLNIFQPLLYHDKMYVLWNKSPFLLLHTMQKFNKSNSLPMELQVSTVNP